jgi:tetratricopeptide (TPR) repeat protein
VDSANVIKYKVVPQKDLPRLEKKISWDLGGKNYLVKNELMILDLIANNNWERPIYFTASGNEACVGLGKYLQMEGLTYRFVPVKQTENEIAQGGRVNTEAMYDNLMHKYHWGGMNKKGVYLDETCQGMAANLRIHMIILASALIGEGKNEKAKEVMDTCLKMIPGENVPFDARMFTLCGEYYELGELEQANSLAKKLFAIFENDLRVYNQQKPKRRNAYSSEIAQAKSILKNLTNLTKNYKQQDLSGEFTERLRGLLSPEDFEPSVPASQLR